MNKPKFDPNKPFEAVKPKFDPNQKFEAVQEAALIGPTSGEAALEGAKAGIPFHNQIGGGVQGLLDLLDKAATGTSVSDVNQQLAAQGFTGPGGAPLPDQTTGEIYSRARDESKAQSQAAQEAHPLSYLLGNLGGGLATAGPLMKAGGAALKGIGALAPETTAAVSGFGKMAAQEAPRLASIAKTGATGAGIGGLYGAGEGDTLGGALLGGIGGAALGTAGQSLGALKDLIKRGGKAAVTSGGLPKQIARAYEMGTEGQGITSQASKLKIAKGVTEQAQKLTDFISDTAEKNWNQKLEAMKKSGQQFNLQQFEDLANESVDWAIQNMGLLPDEAAKVQQTVRQMLYKQIPEKTKEAVNSVIKTTKTVTPKLPELAPGVEMPEGIEGLLKPRITETFKGKGMSPQELASAAQQLPPENFQTLKSQITTAPKTQTQVHTEGLVPEQAVPQALGEVPLSEADQIIRNLQKASGFDATKSTAQQSVLGNIAGKARGAFSAEAPAEVNAATKTAQTLKELTGQLGGEPEAIKSIGESPATESAINLVKNMLNVSDPKIIQNREVIQKMLQKVNPEFAAQFEKEAAKAALDQSIAGEAGKVGLSKLGQTARSIPLTAANVAGQVSKGMSNISRWPVSRIQKLTNALKSEQDPASQRLGTMLEGVSSGDTNKRAAMLFSISQNKDYREMINRLTPGLEEEKK